MQIIALGGGGFSTGSEPGLDTYLLRQSRSTTPRVGFIGTASGDAESYRLKFYARFSKLDCRPSHLSFFGRTPNLEAWILGQDLIFVGGGNSKSMLAVWRDWGLPAILRRAADAGTLLTGISAGAICWFESGVTDSASSGLAPLGCLGFLPGSACPHYSGEAERRPGYERMVGSGEIVPGFAIDDGAALHFVNARATRVVVGRPGAKVYRVEREEGRGVSRSIEDLPKVDTSSSSSSGDANMFGMGATDV
ncbi:MAG: peptidase E [Deltaproteobacteria bacterium]|jgi:peptidase E|nr:peptidase E [Deltaproteobacteria bacterium]